MRILLLFILLTGLLPAYSQNDIPPVGLWREHLPYHSAIDIAAGNDRIYCATPFSLFALNTTDKSSTDRYSRITGLSETGVAAIGYNQANEKLLIAYTNSNIDILYRNDIYNIPDIKRSSIPGNKTVYNIYARNNLFYISAGFGVVVIDADKYETDDTWYIGNNGGQVQVNSFTSDNSFFYAATAEGLKKVSVNTMNPANYANWQMLSGTNGLPAGACQNVFTIQGNVVVQKNDSLFIQTGVNWSLLYNDGWQIKNSNISGNSILLCEQQAGGASRVIGLNNSGVVTNTINNAPVLQPRKALRLNNETWIADETNCLLEYNGNTLSAKYNINSPLHIAAGEMAVYKNKLYATAGAVNSSWVPQNNDYGLYRFTNGEWHSYSRRTYPVFDTLKDLLTIAIDKRDETAWIGSFGGGLLHIKQGNIYEVYKQNFIGPAINNPASYRVAGLVMDADNHLWIANYGAAQPLRVKKADGSWRSFTPPFSLNGNALAQIVIDDNNYKWITSPGGGGLICYNSSASIDAASDDQWRRFGIGAGNLPSNEVYCTARDKHGFIWVGTADGVALFQCPELVFTSGGCDAVLPIVKQGSFAGFLLKGQQVYSIAVDGANRKWMATDKGVYLTDATGEKVVYRFTEENSPLLSNIVSRVTIDGSTGEVFFATAKGICSFRSTATEGGEKNEEVLVFPNPVPPGYTGTIAIKGLVNNAIVKITELDGKLVYQTRALGGQAIWDGKNYRGQRITSGAYLVLITDDAKKERLATKIFYIGR